MGRFWETIGGIFTGLMAVFAIPLMFLNMFGGIVSGVWLLVIGRWHEFLLGLVVLFGGTFLIGFVLIPSMGMAVSSAALMRSGRNWTGLLFGIAGSAWTYLIMFIWCLFTFVTMTKNPDGNMFPLALWGYANAVGPWSYMASKDGRDSGSGIAVFGAQLGSLAMIVAAVFLGAEPSVSGLSPFLLPFIVGAALIQLVLVLALAVEASARS